MSRVRFVAAMTLLNSVPAVAAGSAIAPINKTSPISGLTIVTGFNRLDNVTKVDGAESTETNFSAVDAKLRYDRRPFSASVAAGRLVRDITAKQLANDLDKETVRLRPEVGFRTADYTEVTAGYEAYQTKVANGLTPDDDYSLDTGRGIVGVTRDDGQSRLTLAFSTEARAEKEYEAIPGYVMVDRDYIPAQADVAYLRAINSRLNVAGAVRYSHYNDDVYKDQYDSDVPSTPTLGQVFDYLLSFKAGATYALSDMFAISTEIGRKAALDTNTYVGDEYLVGTSGKLAGYAQLDRRSTVGLGYTTSTGAKTHEVQGRSYDYANRQSGFEASLTVAM